jgi:NAD(P)-dependent dehydrogenase (short-subunit alcohol dehydrogenase family)
MSDTPKNVVITGSTRGIGRGMAREFLKRGHSVAITSRGQIAVDEALAYLTPFAAASGAKLTGVPSDVSHSEQVQKLWDLASSDLGEIDIWINNAGVTNTGAPIAWVPSEQFDIVATTNLVGSMICCQVALKGMQAQGHGALYNFEGFGSNGMQSPGNHIYGSTKYAIRHFTKALIQETKESPVIVGYMSPGIVLTDLTLAGKEKMPPKAWESVKKIYNILADREETVTPFLVDGVLENKKHGGRVHWLTRRKSAWRFFKSRFQERDVISEYEG